MLSRIDILLIHLLQTITQIEKRLSETKMKNLQKYIAMLSYKQCELHILLDQSIEDQIDIISDMVVLIGRLYRKVPRHLRAYVFQDYEHVPGFELGEAYAPKAEIEYFCIHIEPRIHECRVIETDSQEDGYANTTSDYYATKIRK